MTGNHRPASAEAPPAAGNRVVAFAVTLAMITYLDRVAFAQAAPEIRSEYHLTDTQMGLLMAAFGWAYMIFEVPGGWLADSFGPRKLLMRVVCWWSLFTAATAWAWSFPSLLATRFFFGAGEAGCFPGITRAFANWLTGPARVRAQSLTWAAARWGGAFTPLLVLWVTQALGAWRRAFEVFGLIGLLWAIWFWRNFRDHPPGQPAEPAVPANGTATSASVGPHPWRSWLARPAVWLLCVQYALVSVGFWFYTNWLPTYLREGRGLEFKGAGAALLAGMPLFLGGVSCLISGRVLAWLELRLGDPDRARRWLAFAGFAGAGASLLLAMATRDVGWALAATGLAVFCNDLTMPGSWATCMDLGGAHAGVLAGAMNMAGSLGGMASPLMTGWLLDLTHRNWNAPLGVIVGAYFLGGLCWFGIHQEGKATGMGR